MRSALLFWAVLLLFPSVAIGEGRIWWESGMVKLRAENGGPEGDPIPPGADLCHAEKCSKGGVRLSAAQNEFEPFQIFVAAPEEDLKNVDITFTDLADEKGTPRISSRLPGGDIFIYREYYIEISKPTNKVAKRGIWPDALIPKIDAYFGEKRSMPGEGRPAFPFDVPKGTKQGIWIDLYVPPETPPGNYSGSATVTVGGQKKAVIPVRLTVHPFRLPSTASLRNAYAVGISEVMKGHDWDHPKAKNGYLNDDRTSELICIYTKALLLHRLSNENALWPPPRWDKENERIRWKWPEGKTSCQEKYPEFLNGINSLAGGKLKGARLTSIRLRDGFSFTDPDRYDPSKLIPGYYQDFTRYASENGWLDRLFDYTLDEPKFGFQRSTGRRECWDVEDSPEKPDTDWDKIKRRAEFLHKHAPGLKVMVTIDRQAAETCFQRLFEEKDVKKYIDIWTVGASRMDGRPDTDTYNRNLRGTYDEAFITKGKELWWYHACGSHGCGDGSESGYPTVMVDLPSIYARIFEWLTYANKISGELYYETIFQYPYSYKQAKGSESKVPDKNPFLNVYYFGGHGDGILFYPGRPADIGGTLHIPIESIRLKMIREGFEDYEYLKLVEGKKGREWVEAEILTLLKKNEKTPLGLHEWTERAERLLEAREKLAAAMR